MLCLYSQGSWDVDGAIANEFIMISELDLFIMCIRVCVCVCMHVCVCACARVCVMLYVVLTCTL